MAISFDQVVRIITEQAEEVVVIFNRALWLDAFSANREYAFSFAQEGKKPPFEIFAEARVRWDFNQLAQSLETGLVDEEGNVVEESYLDLEISVALPPFSSLPDLAQLRANIRRIVPQYNPPIFNLSYDCNIDAPGETVYHLKLDYLWSFEGEARILTARFADVFNDIGDLIRELGHSRSGWQLAHYT